MGLHVGSAYLLYRDVGSEKVTYRCGLLGIEQISPCQNSSLYTCMQVADLSAICLNLDPCSCAVNGLQFGLHMTKVDHIAFIGYTEVDSGYALATKLHVNLET